MGCAHSRVEKEESVRRCRDRRRLMKQLLIRRAELTGAHMAYLQSLRNTGATLRQFTDVDSIIPEPTAPFLPSSPPPPPRLPPSPPPPPPFSPEIRKLSIKAEPAGDNLIDSDDDDDGDTDIENECHTPPPPHHLDPTWGFWDPFGLPPPPPKSSSSFSSSSSLPPLKKNGGANPEVIMEEEKWAEANTDFGEEEEIEGEANVGVAIPAREKSPIREVVDDDSSAVSWFTKDTDMAVVLWRSKKTLAGIMKELDDYFLKAAAGGKDVAVLLESNRGHHLNRCLEKVKAKRSRSAKVFNTLTWSWSSRSPHSFRDSCAQNTDNSFKLGNHCATLEKLYAEEQTLYKDVKDEEISKLQHKKKGLLLHKLETRDHEWSKVDKMRADIEELECRIVSSQESISGTCLSISKLRDEELWPQLAEISFGIMHMWRTMYECHQVQNHIAQQVNLLEKHPGAEPTTDSLYLATTQLETEANFWYTSFCNLLRSQREYVHILNQWMRLTDCLPDNNGESGPNSGIHALCEEWQRVLERLPIKVAAEAIKSFVSVIHSIAVQQTEERELQKRSVRLESRLERELSSLNELEDRSRSPVGDSAQLLGSNHHSFAAKRAKLDALKKRTEEEKAKYLNSIRVSRAMTLNNLQTALPNVFQALMGFASVCAQAFEGVCGPNEAVKDQHLEDVVDS